MKRRVISMLAIIALLCTMVVFAMPAAAGDAATYPCYKDHAAQTAAGYDGKNWSISSKADWAAMRDVADVATEDYFAGVTFHLTNDIDFDFEKISPMGINTNGAAFAGTIDGHGFGFSDLYVANASKYEEAHVVSGLFLRLGNCTIKDFGINNGYIQQTSSNNQGSTSSFGAIDIDKKPSFERVWSSANLIAVCNAQASGLAGTFEHKDAALNVNGFIFDGDILKGSADNHNYQFSYGVCGTYNSAMADGDNFYNIITDFASLNGTGFSLGEDGSYTYDSGDRGVKAALFTFSSEDKFNAATIENVYAVKRAEKGINVGYFLGKNSTKGGDSSNSLLTEMSALEAAWTINNNPTATNPVYFTLKGDKIRPIPEGKSDGRIIKVQITGDVTKSYFMNAGSTIDLAAEIGYKPDLQELTFVAGEGSRIEGTTLYLGNNDTTLNMNITCAHDGGFDYTAGENNHTKACKAGCGVALVEDCSAPAYTVDPITEEQLLSGEKATHSGTCQFCGEAFTLDCTYEYVIKDDAANVWDYSACPCGRENVVHQASAPILCGDADNNGKLDLIDAIRMLKKIATIQVDVHKRNADMDGDNDLGMQDVSLMIRVWMGDVKAINKCAAVQQRANVANHYDADNITFQSLKMDGSLENAAGYAVTDAIAVDKGNQITFGPVRLGQPVLGFFFDAENQPMELIQYTDVEVAHTFEQGMAMVTAEAPEGAVAVKLQLNQKEKDLFYARINTDFTVMDYEYRTGADASELVNPFYDQTLLTTGDSICAAAADSKVDGLKGWAKRIHLNFGANVTNSGVSGAALSTTRVQTKENATLQHQIFNQVMQHVGSKEFDYLLLHGGVNDAWDDVPIGEMSDSFDPSTFDLTTFAGGMEMLFYTAVKNYGDTAALGYIINFESPLHSKANDSGKYFVEARKILEKWGIPYLDLYNDYKFDTDKYTKPISTTNSTSDKIHPTEEGYDLLQPYIDAFLPKMRPISYDVWSKVCYGADRAVDESGGPLFTASENPYKESLKILAIGNSFSADATQYLWDIANSYGAKNVVIGNMHIGGCSLDTHYSNMVMKFSGNAYSYSKNSTGEKVTTSNVSIEDALKDEDWDIITLQQASDQNATIDTYKYMGPILSYLNKNKPKEDTKILWHMTWAYQSDSTKGAFAAYDNDQQKMYNVLLDRARYNMSTFDDFAGVIPAGTAIQNLRGTKVGDTVTRDGYHMSYGLGRYTVALTWYCYITGADPRAVTFIPSNEYTAQITPYTKEIGESVWEAIQDPYNVR